MPWQASQDVSGYGALARFGFETFLGTDEDEFCVVVGSPFRG